MGPIVALILSILIALGGSGAVVYAAQDALPNEPLYAVKILSEDARVNLTGDDAARANLMLDLALRRANEIAATNGTNARVIEREQAQIASALQIAAQLNDAQMNQVLARAREVLNQTLQTIPATAAAQARETITNQNGVVQAGLDDPATFRLRFHPAPPRPSPYPIELPPPPITATVPIAPPRATLPFSGTVMPPPHGTPPLTATIPIPHPGMTPPPFPSEPRPTMPPPFGSPPPTQLPKATPPPNATPMPPTMIPMPTLQHPPTMPPFATIMPMLTRLPPPPPPSGVPPMATPRRP